MTVIVERSGGCDRRSDILRKRLLESGIPCAVIGLEDYPSVLGKKCVVTFEGVLPPDVPANPENVLICDGVALTSDDPDVSEREVKRVRDRVTEVLELVFGVRYGMHYGKLYAEDGEISYYFGTRINFTPTEKLVIRHAVFSPGVYLSSEEIASFTLADRSGASVRTHVWSVNRKAKICTGFPLIVTRRGRGYVFEDA